jgi:hypothetical protein
MKLRTCSVVCILLIILSGCDGLDSIHLTGNYYLVDIEYDSLERSLSYKTKAGGFVGVVEPTVSEYWFDRRYIVVKQNRKFPSEFVSSPETNYYIVDMHVENIFMPEKGVTGPLTLNEFQAECEKLGIHNAIKFKK